MIWDETSYLTAAIHIADSFALDVNQEVPPISKIYLALWMPKEAFQFISPLSSIRSEHAEFPARFFEKLPENLRKKTVQRGRLAQRLLFQMLTWLMSISSAFAIPIKARPPNIIRVSRSSTAFRLESSDFALRPIQLLFLASSQMSPFEMQDSLPRLLRVLPRARLEALVLPTRWLSRASLGAHRTIISILLPYNQPLVTVMQAMALN